MMRVHERFRDIENLFAKYRMDRFTNTAQVDDLLSKGIISPIMAHNLKEEIETRNEAKSIRCF